MQRLSWCCRNVMCGSLLCHALAGVKLQSYKRMESWYVISRGNMICASTVFDVYPGVLDLGYVPDGAQCGDNMVGFLVHHCVPVSSEGCVSVMVMATVATCRVRNPACTKRMIVNKIHMQMNYISTLGLPSLKHLNDFSSALTNNASTEKNL